MGINKKTKLKSLSHGRPPMIKKPTQRISSKATRTIIRNHHTLEKRKAKALAEGDEVTAAALAREIASQGGLESYQRASLIGQGSDRGGDSSKILMDWLAPLCKDLKGLVEKNSPVRMLEVGALSTTNACSKSHTFNVERIDLNSQSEGITQQDFMERPLPKDETEKFNIISLSLVLNYVPDGVGRGNMLLRTRKFLETICPSGEGFSEWFPALFLVLQNYTTSWDPLALYAYARKLDLETLMNHTLDLIRHVDNAQKSFHGIQAIQKVFHPDAMLQVPSPLQVYVVQLAVHMMRIKEQGKYYTIETADFVTLLQLRGFAEQFVNANRWRDVRDPRAPFFHNKCSYHAHHDDKACEAQKYILNCDVERLEA